MIIRNATIQKHRSKSDKDYFVVRISQSLEARFSASTRDKIANAHRECKEFNGNIDYQVDTYEQAKALLDMIMTEELQ